MKKRKEFNMSKIDTVTLDVMYNEKLLRINEIAYITGKTRQRIWQLLKEYGLHNKSRVVRCCLNCGKSFEVVRSRARSGSDKYCKEQCYFDHKASFNYIPDRQGQRIGRKVIEDWLGHSLPEGFIVHHEDGDQSNNGIDNLIVFPSNSEHIKYHHAKRNYNAIKPYDKLYDLPIKIDEWIKGVSGKFNNL